MPFCYRLRVSNPEIEDENQIILKAMIDINLPKFLSHDVELFKDIVKDIFKGTNMPELDREELLASIKAQCGVVKLQPTDWFVSKVMQLYELLLVRHGIMIIGNL